MARHKCTKELYQAFLQASSVRYSGLALSEVSPFELSHDSISRWLSQKELRPRDVWQKAQAHIDKQAPCLLIADDTVLDKQYSSHIELVQYQYSGNEHDIIPGIGLVNMLWYGLEQEEAIPIDYRIYDKTTDGKTKNNHFCDMLKLAKSRGLNPDAVVMDSWYSSLKNLKTIRNHGWMWVTTLRKNRKVNRDETLEKLDIPDEGRQVHLRGYGWITVFKFEAKNGRIDYVATSKEKPSRDQIKDIITARWSIEVYHRELKQTCGIERCQARHSRSQRNHIYMSIMAWFNKHTQRISKKISMYQQDWEVIKKGIALEIKSIMLAI
ncbi:MAG: transposase [Candidatus Amoebophilus sp. 36-38]|mgnify:CR=1 FL=1|nr:MAG: transposase [Candidatus Amoebophilus sp. 36-38]